MVHPFHQDKFSLTPLERRVITFVTPGGVGILWRFREGECKDYRKREHIFGYYSYFAGIKLSIT
jgi:hypothetical protein